MRALNALGRITVVALVAAVACEPVEEEDIAPLPIAPQLAKKNPDACDFGRMAQDARSYFPGNGRGSTTDSVLELVDAMEDACAAGESATYTSHWYSIAALLEGVLEEGEGGDPVDGGNFLAASVSVLGPDGETPIFDPCGVDDTDCQPWDGYPTPPDFTSVLASPDGMWAVVSSETEAVCSSFTHPCETWDAAANGDAWGVEPSESWQAALWDRQTVVFGRPLTGPSPTGELLLQEADLPAYEMNLIPDPLEFAVDAEPPAVLEVGLCTDADLSFDEQLVQKNTTVLNEAQLDWCASQITSLPAAPNSTWDRILAFLSPTPAPLVATSTALALRGPGGLAGSFTDFYAVDVPALALLGLSSQPADGTVGEQIKGQDREPLVIRSFTSSTSPEGSPLETPLENATIELEVVGNLGLVPAGDSISVEGMTCEGFECSGFTQADEDDDPGSLELPLVITKTGSYSLCFTADLPPLQFAEPLCTEKFNVRP